MLFSRWWATKGWFGGKTTKKAGPIIIFNVREGFTCCGASFFPLAQPIKWLKTLEAVFVCSSETNRPNKIKDKIVYGQIPTRKPNNR